MIVRGAPLIGVTAAYGVALAMRDEPGDAHLARAVELLAATRPTAVNLRWALERVAATLSPEPAARRADLAWQAAAAIADEDVAACAAIGQHGRAVFEQLAARRQEQPLRVLTHCNAGWLACVDWGTALAPIYMAHDKGIPVHVWVDETRPRNQGLLTAWELAGHGVPHTLVADNAGGHLMQHGKVDMVIVGADRVTRRGDVANKVGTYLKALAARDNDVPFYAAVPTPTIDWEVDDALSGIPIEERSGEELRVVRGLDGSGRPASVSIAPESTAVANPAFDVTPAALVTGIITDRGVFPARETALLGLYPSDLASKAFVT
jgi:methylthioribose-1-phosphate isomerase